MLIKEVQRDPVKDDLLHVDFQQVAMTETIRVTVPLHFVGEAPAAKVKDGMVLHPISSLEVEALPGDSTWEDLMYQIYVRETIEAGLADSEAGRVTDVEKVRQEFGLPA